MRSIAWAGWMVDYGLFLVYVVGLVGIAGQTLGMMIMDLRVVSDRFDRIGLTRALLRYACLIGSIVGVIGILKIFGRVQPFERWSRTRPIEGAAVRAQPRSGWSAAVRAGIPVTVVTFSRLRKNSRCPDRPRMFRRNEER